MKIKVSLSKYLRLTTLSLCDRPGASSCAQSRPEFIKSMVQLSVIIVALGGTLQARGADESMPTVAPVLEKLLSDHVANVSDLEQPDTWRIARSTDTVSTRHTRCFLSVCDLPNPLCSARVLLDDLLTQAASYALLHYRDRLHRVWTLFSQEPEEIIGGNGISLLSWKLLFQATRIPEFEELDDGTLVRVFLLSRRLAEDELSTERHRCLDFGEFCEAVSPVCVLQRIIHYLCRPCITIYVPAKPSLSFSHSLSPSLSHCRVPALPFFTDYPLSCVDRGKIIHC